jgi:hypothetical protein
MAESRRGCSKIANLGDTLKTAFMLCVQTVGFYKTQFFTFSRTGTRAFLVLPGEDGLKSSGIPAA